MRDFDQFKPLDASQGNLNHLGSNNVVGSAIVKNGSSHVFCGITVGIIEANAQDDLLGSSEKHSPYTSVYPVVDIARGRQGAPSDEEMILSQSLYNHVFLLKLLPVSSLAIVPGYQINDHNENPMIYYPDDKTLEESDLLSLNAVNITNKHLRYVLYAHIKVFSREGPLFDSVHHALLNALKNTSLPRVYMADSGIDPNVRVPVRSRGNFGHLNQSAGLYCLDANPEKASPLKLDLSKDSISSSFGVVEVDEKPDQLALLADLEGEAEETPCESKINIIASSSSKLNHVSVAGGGANVTLDVLKEAIHLSTERAKNLLSAL